MTITNPTLETIAKRATCRNYTDEVLSEDELEAIALAAVQSPSAVNAQPWRVIAITSPELIAELEVEGMKVLTSDPDRAKFAESIQKRGGKLFYNAPAIFYIPIDPEARGLHSAERDCGIVAQNISLAAESLGLGSCICGLAQLPLQGEKGEEFTERLQFPKGWEFGIAVLVGKAVEVKEPHAPDLEKITYIK